MVPDPPELLPAEPAEQPARASVPAVMRAAVRVREFLRRIIASCSRVGRWRSGRSSVIQWNKRGVPVSVIWWVGTPGTVIILDMSCDHGVRTRIHGKATERGLD
ncbi:hypothetical protein GCM10009805_30530 [Leucobacter chromiireducens subsp. solipictus]